MPIHITCESCGKKLLIREEIMGKKVKCPACASVFRAESAAAPPGESVKPGSGSAARDKVSARPPAPKVRPPDEDDEDDFEERRARARRKRKRRKAPSANLMWIGIAATVVILMLGVGGVILFLRPAAKQAGPVAQNQARPAEPNDNDPAPPKKARPVNAKANNEPDGIRKPTQIGPKVLHGHYEVFYTDGATREEADRLGAHLVKAGDAARRATVHLKKSAAGYQFRVPINKEFQNDPVMLKHLEFDTARISRDVFEGAPVELHVCDVFMRTLQAIPPRADLRYGVVEDKAEVFFASDADRGDALRLAKYLAMAFKESPGPILSFKMLRRGAIVEVHMVTKKELLNDTVLADLGRIRGDIAASIFMGATVELHLCDDLLEVFQVLQK